MSNKNLSRFGLIIVLVFFLFNLVLSQAGFSEILRFEPNDSLEEIQEKIKHNGYSFTVAHNWVFDMPKAEKERFFSRFKSGRERPLVLKGSGPLADRLGRQALPAKFDWRNVLDTETGETKSFIGPVRNQGDCGCCYAFAACAAAEGTYNFARSLYNENTADFSEAFLAFCLSKNYEGFDGCEGTDYDYDELDAIIYDGLPFESVMPYSDQEMQCDGAAWHAPRKFFWNWYRIPSNSIEEIKTALSIYGVLDVAVNVNDAFQAYNSGVYQDQNTECPYEADTITNHAVSLVGWDDDPPGGGGGVWILRNSWGSSWGENGYMRIRYQSAAVACAATYLEPDHWPEVTTGQASNISLTSAVLNGTISPYAESLYSYWNFEYGESAENLTEGTPGAEDYGTDTINVLATISGLKPGTQYFFRLTADSSLGPVQTFTTSALLPDIISAGATEITSDSARLVSTINPGGNTTEYYFEYGETDSYGFTTAVLNVGSGIDGISVTSDVSGLYPASSYHFRVVATNAIGTTMGEDKTFVTSPVPPLVEIKPTQTITPNSVAFHGIITPFNKETFAFVEYGKTVDYGSFSPMTNAGSGRNAVPVEISLSTLSAARTYHYRLGASNVAGMTFSEDQTFTTKADVPYVLAVAADEIMPCSVQLKGIVNPHNSETLYYIDYGLTMDYGLKTGEKNAGAGDEDIAINETVSDLLIATDLHYRVVATNVAGTAYSEDRIVKTAAAAPFVRSDKADLLPVNRAMVYGLVDAFNSETDWFVEYGETTAYGESTEPVSAGPAIGESAVKCELNELDSGTIYHYRFVASNVAGTTYGDDATFKTRSGSNNCFISTVANELSIELSF